MSTRTLSILAAGLLTVAVATGPVRAEDEPATPTPDERVKAALATYRSTPPRLFSGQVRRPAESASAVRTVMVGMGSAGKPFEGRFDAWTPEGDDERAVILSEHDVPGFGIWMRGDRTVTESRSDDSGSGYDAASIRPALLALLDADRVTKWLGKARWKQSGTSGDQSTYEAEVSRRIVPPSAKSNAAVAPVRVLDAHALITLDKDGRIARLELRVRESDPLASLRRRALRERAAELPPGFDVDGEEADGSSTTYVLSPSSREPSQRLRAFAARMASARVR